MITEQALTYFLTKYFCEWTIEYPQIGDVRITVDRPPTTPEIEWLIHNKPIGCEFYIHVLGFLDFYYIKVPSYSYLMGTKYNAQSMV